MQREEKQLDSALEAILMRVNNAKAAISSMLFKIEHEHETLNWPNFLDNFALISGHLSSLTKILTHGKVPNLHNFAVLPLHLSPDRDEDLVKMTEGRISTFAHDLVPDYLRTKQDPSVELKIQSYEAKISNLSNEACHKQVVQFNKVIQRVCEIVSKAREEWDSDTGSRTTLAQTSSTADTHLLVSAVGSGNNIKRDIQIDQLEGNSAEGNMIIGKPGRQTQSSGQGPMVGQMLKAPSIIKTNIKAASQMRPYNRQ